MATSQDPKQAWVERVLGLRLPDASGEPAGAKRPQGAAVRVAHGLLEWNSARARVGDELAKLQQAVLEQCQGEPDYDQIKANIGKLDVILERLDDRLSEKLEQLRATDDPEEKTRLSGESVQIVKAYQAYVSTDELMNDIDDNGFIPLKIKSSVETALAAVLEAI